MANQKLSKESEPREGKNERKRKRGLTEMMRTEHTLFAKDQNRGTNGSPRRPEKLHYKRRGWVVKKAEKKKERNTIERRDSLEKLSESLGRKKILRENKYCFPISCKSNYGTYSDPTRIKLRKF